MLRSLDLFDQVEHKIPICLSTNWIKLSYVDFELREQREELNDNKLFEKIKTNHTSLSLK